MSDEDSWRKKALEAIEILKKVSQPPLEYATLVDLHSANDTADIALAGGRILVVNYDPRLKKNLKVGQTVQLSPETYAIVSIDGDIKNRTATVVKDILKDGRIKVEDNGADKIIISTVPNLKVGDNVVVDNSKSVVLENLGNTTKAYSLDKVSVVPWDSIGGLESTIEDIKDTIELPFYQKEIYSKFPNKKLAKGILLYGPPGCGKTMLGKSIAYNLALRKKERDGGELNGYFLYVAGPEFLQMYVGVGEAKVRELFANARETSAKNGDPVIIFIDEPEAVLKKRGSGISSDASDPIVNQFLVEMDGLNSLDNIVVLLATNREDIIDPAILRPGRIDRKIHVPRPNKQGAEQIFSLYLKDMPLANESLFKKGAKLVREYAAFGASEVFDRPMPILDITYNDGSRNQVHYKDIFCGASVVSIIGRSTDYAIKRAISGARPELTKDDLSKGVEKEYLENRAITSQVTREDLMNVAGEKFDKIVEVTPTRNYSRAANS